MKKKSLPKKDSRDQIRREKDPIPWRYCLLTLFCGVLLVGGFFMAARSHFASMDFGFRNSSLKKQLEDLESEKRRLMWLKEVALKPEEIKKAAKKLGLTENSAAASTALPAVSAAAARSDRPAEKTAPLVAKTVESKPVEAKAAARPAERLAKNGAPKDAARPKTPSPAAKK